MHFFYRSVLDDILLYPADALMCCIDKQSEFFKSIAFFENVFYFSTLLVAIITSSL